MSEQLRRIQFVTTYYDWVQGLRFVPVGLLSLGMAIWLSLASTEPRKQVGLVLVLGGGAVAAVLYGALGVYYRRRFGVVRGSANTRKRMWRAIGVSVVVGGVFGALFAASRKQLGSGSVPVALWMLVFALGIAWYWHWSGRVAHHYLAVAAGVGVLGLLDALGASPVCAVLQKLPFTTDSRCAAVTLMGTMGLAVLVMSVLDHRLLVRMLGDPPESESGSKEAPE
jgi:hypothetical protein